MCEVVLNSERCPFSRFGRWLVFYARSFPGGEIRFFFGVMLCLKASESGRKEDLENGKRGERLVCGRLCRIQ